MTISSPKTWGVSNPIGPQEGFSQTPGKWYFFPRSSQTPVGKSPLPQARAGHPSHILSLNHSRLGKLVSNTCKALQSSTWQFQLTASNFMQFQLTKGLAFIFGIPTFHFSIAATNFSASGNTESVETMPTSPENVAKKGWKQKKKSARQDKKKERKKIIGKHEELKNQNCLGLQSCPA